MMHRISVIAATCACALFACAAQAQSAVAMVTDIQGDVSITSAGKVTAPTIATALVAGMRVDIRPGGVLTALELSTGDELHVAGPAVVELRDHDLAATPPASVQRKATRLGQVKLRQDRLAQAAMVMRAAGAIERLPLLSPVNTVLLETQPTFRWSAVSGAGPYRFELLDDDGNSLYQARTSASELALPGGIRLVEGKAYTWEVSARRSDGARFESVTDFSVAPGALRDAAEQLRPASEAPVSEWSAYAMWLEGNGLAEMAREAWMRIARERPNDTAVKRLSAR